MNEFLWHLPKAVSSRWQASCLEIFQRYRQLVLEAESRFRRSSFQAHSAVFALLQRIFFPLPLSRHGLYLFPLLLLSRDVFSFSAQCPMRIEREHEER